MLRKIELSNFKCYKSAQIDLSALTVFSGRNAVGKSTVLQAFRLMRQLALRQGDGDVVSIDGPLVRFGSVDGLVNSRSPRGQSTRVSVEVLGDLETECARMALERIDPVRVDALNEMRLVSDASLANAELTQPDFVYLSADRISPDDAFGYPDMDFGYKCNPMGNRGEFAAWHLGMAYQKRIPIDGFIHPKSEGRETFGQQVSLWMGNLGQEMQVEPRMYDEIRSAGFRFAVWEGDSFSKWYSPINVGFGLTHSLPIFVTLLSRPRGALVLIENPESHLHPKAQVEMGRFLSKAASLGIQVMVETHSDHVLNGIRLSVREKTLSPDEVALNFMTTDAGEVMVVRPNLLPSGAVDVWPRGFFDEYENVSLELI